MKTPTVPDRLLLRMTYKDNINLAGNALFWSKATFRANSIYDPDLSVINGHQPLGFDQWTSFYNQYRVYKCLVKATINNNQSGQIQCGIIPYNSQQALDYNDSIFEQPHAATRTAGSTNGSSQITIVKMIDVPRVLGMSHLQYKTSTATSSLALNNPAESCLFDIIARLVNGSASVAASCVLEVTYFVELFDRTGTKLSYPAGKDPLGHDASGNPYSGGAPPSSPQ